MKYVLDGSNAMVNIWVAVQLERTPFTTKWIIPGRTVAGIEADQFLARDPKTLLDLRF
jgi:hypothetical protein